MAWHGLYSDKRWQQLRQRQLLVEPWCAVCGARATDVDHIKPHRGDLRLFLDEGNLQSLCHSCHSKKTAKETLQRQQEK